MTRDIYQVMQKMGYTKVSMTQRYARFEINELSYDFPTLIEASNKPKFDAVDLDLMDTNKVVSLYLSCQIFIKNI